MARARELVKALWEAARAEPNASLARLEEGVLGVVRGVLPDLLAEVVRANVTALDPARASQRVACPACGGPTRRQSWRERQVVTSCGTLRFERPWQVCQAPDCGHGFSPVDQTLELTANAKVSAGLQQWLAALGSTTSFAEAAELLGELTGVAVSAETVRHHTGVVGCRLEAQQQAAITHVQSQREAADPVVAAPGLLVVEADGGMVRFRDADGVTGSPWHEVKAGVVGGVVDGHLTALSYVAAREPAEQFGPRLLAEAARRGALEVVAWHGGRTDRALAELRPVTVLGDGAAWIWDLASEHFGAAREVLDYWHACEHLTVIAHAVFGPGDTATAWAAEQRRQLREAGGEAVQTVLATLQAPTAEGADVLRRERAYFRTHTARTDYPAVRAAGLPMASGAVEGGGVNGVVMTRLKRPGCRWSQAGADAVLHVRCHRLSGRPLAA